MELEEKTGFAPQASVNHFSSVPEPATAERIIVPASSGQKLSLSVVAMVGATGSGSIVTSALRFITETHDLLFVATTVYVPISVILLKLIGLPSPTTADAVPPPSFKS